MLKGVGKIKTCKDNKYLFIDELLELTFLNQKRQICQSISNESKSVKESPPKTEEKSKFQPVKAIKHKKMVYCQKNSNEDDESTSLVEFKEKSKTKITNTNKKSIKNNLFLESLRSSQYRGVSKNGKQWQVLIMVKNQKLYLGTFKTELEAARHYDYYSIKHHGIKAKTNFYYDKGELEKIKQS